MISMPISKTETQCISTQKQKCVTSLDGKHLNPKLKNSPAWLM